MKLISIIVPCFNEEEVLPLYYQEMNRVMEKMKDTQFELFFVDDGSRDGTLSILKRLHEKDQRCRYISFSRNFGKEAAIYAGLSHAKGDYVGLMDADLQDPPEMLLEMYDILEDGEYDCVGTRRIDRQGEPVIRSFFSDCFYRVMNKISDVNIVRGARDYRLMTRRMTDAVLKISERNRFSKGIFEWVGFETKWLEYHNTERAAGETKWSFYKLLLYSIQGITCFSVSPLYLASGIGAFFCIAAFLFIILIVVRTFLWGDPTQGWPSLVCIILMISGIQLLCLGIIGQYLSRTYLETKDRPLYLVKEESTDKEKR
ncbi:MAG: glycosyltransferase family 2 protein [Anaerostipes sp.]|uniref:glycosyltransferase family 2 protein n=1 Tax=Anaerostipes sp. 992a TaxID=1261637 RepID=UPI0009524ECE|nr:glycosyltransferase family 2 protein [Anaerostipes sp. 992a]MCI5952653.1 glycosyltransferase family 2 protein [Anaerostipes sp.]MDD5969300.1 glycosyltransferase family 2 protein [Anaerostipes sp.]OLR63951.1 bactoprenol glucosyl transferase [Anaerostipes sp. 992a]